MFSLFWQIILNLLFPTPSRCLLCRQPLIDGGTESTSSICSICLEEAYSIKEPLCGTCGKASNGGWQTRCPDCSREARPFVWARAAVQYRGVAKDMIMQLKFRSQRELLDPLTTWLHQGWVAHCPDLALDAIVYVPMLPEAQRIRGFNQAEELARRLGERVGIPVDDVLVRAAVSGSQTTRNRAERKAALNEAFALTQYPPSKTTVAGKRLLLIDDVFTTGSTVSACTSVLLSGGAKSVYVLTVAR